MLDDGIGSIATSALLGEGPGESGDDNDLPSPLPPPMVFSIRSGEYRIGSFVLHKAEFCAGDIVLGNFDFSSATIRCLQVHDAEGVFPEGTRGWNGSGVIGGSSLPMAGVLRVVLCSTLWYQTPLVCVKQANPLPPGRVTVTTLQKLCTCIRGISFIL